MNQLSNEPHLLWGTVVTVFLTLVVLGKPVEPAGQRSPGRADAPAAHGHIYTGPSSNYAATPHAGSLTYADPGPVGETRAGSLRVATGVEEAEHPARLTR